MKIIEANIQGTMSTAKIEHDIEKLSKVGWVEFVLWSEITYPKSKKALKKFYPDEKWIHVHENTEVPISINKKHWEYVTSGRLKTHGGLIHISPQRFIVWVIVKHKATGAQLVVTNSHWVSGAWRAKNSFLSWRRRMWNTHFAKHKALVKEFTSAGYSVVGGGDWNRLTVSRFTDEQSWLGHHGLDYIYTIPNASAGMSVHGIDSGRYDGYNTDHKPLWATIRFKFNEDAKAPRKVANPKAIRS